MHGRLHASFRRRHPAHRRRLQVRAHRGLRRDRVACLHGLQDGAVLRQRQRAANQADPNDRQRSDAFHDAAHAALENSGRITADDLEVA